MTSALAPCAPSSAFSSWSIVSSEMALRACGRSMVMTASPSSKSRSTIKRSPSAVLAFSLSENSIASGLEVEPNRRCPRARRVEGCQLLPGEWSVVVGGVR